MPAAIVRELGDTTRGPSPSIWARENWLDLLDAPGRGCTWWDDFMSIPITPPTTEGNWGNYAAFTSTGGTMIDGSTLGGAVTLASDDDNEGASFRTVVCPFKIAQGQFGFAWEARIKTANITDTKVDFFAGLIENVAFTATVPIQASGAMADKNFVGFYHPETATKGAICNPVYKADGVTMVTVVADAITMVADTYFKVGMRYWPTKHISGNNYVLAFYKDGVELGYKVIPSAAGTDFPNDINLGLAFAVLNAAAASPGSLTIDWVRAAQAFAR